MEQGAASSSAPASGLDRLHVGCLSWPVCYNLPLVSLRYAEIMLTLIECSAQPPHSASHFPLHHVAILLLSCRAILVCLLNCIEYFCNRELFFGLQARRKLYLPLFHLIALNRTQPLLQVSSNTTSDPPSPYAF